MSETEDEIRTDLNSCRNMNISDKPTNDDRNRELQKAEANIGCPEQIALVRFILQLSC